MDCRCSHHCRARQTWFQQQQPAPPTSHLLPIFIFGVTTAKMETAGFAHFELQKSSSETYGWLSRTLRPFLDFAFAPVHQPLSSLLTLLMCQINHFQLESNVTILKLGMQKVSYLRHARRQKLFFPQTQTEIAQQSDAYSVTAPSDSPLYPESILMVCCLSGIPMCNLIEYVHRVCICLSICALLLYSVR